MCTTKPNITQILSQMLWDRDRKS